MNKFKIAIIWTTVLSPFLVLFTLILLAKTEFFGELPSFDQLENPKNNLATEIISHDGVVLGKYFFENRSRVKYEEIPQDLVNALVATEDVRFYNHSGIDARALLRAVLGVLSGSSNTGGASTITQQLAKMLFTEQPSTGIQRVIQKLKEWVIAAELEKHYTKAEIITMYLNRFDWVNNAVGVKSASKVYFNKKPEELEVWESAVLIGMLKNPALYNPNIRLEKTLERRDVVLRQMNKYKFLNDSLLDTLVKMPLTLDFKRESHNEGLAPYLREVLRGYLKKWSSENFKPNGKAYNIYTDGLKIHTTINSKMQLYAENAVKTHISQLQDDFYNHWKGYTKAPYPDDFEWEQINDIIDQGMRRSERYKKLKKQGKSEGEIRKVFNTKT